LDGGRFSGADMFRLKARSPSLKRLDGLNGNRRALRRTLAETAFEGGKAGLRLDEGPALYVSP
jgi:hypothetical protein